MAYYHVTTAGADTKTGADWAHAMDWAAFKAYYEDTPADGDIIYFKEGTYTVSASVNGSTSGDATVAAPITFIGVVSATTHEGADVVLTDWATGAARPIFSCGANNITIGDYTKIYNIKNTSSNYNAFIGGAGCLFYNCYFENTASNGVCVNTGTYAKFIHCELEGGATATALSAGAGSFALFCLMRDTGTGVGGGGVSLINCIIDTCPTGVSVAAYTHSLIMNTTIYNSTTAVSGSTGGGYVCINNIIDTATDAFKWTTQTDLNFFAYNHVGNSITDMWDGVEETIAAHKDNWVTGGAGDDPEFNDEANGDFKLASTSPCIDAGMALTLGTSAAGKFNQGAYFSTQVQAGGGGAPRFGDMTGGLK